MKSSLHSEESVQDKVFLLQARLTLFQVANSCLSDICSG